MALYDLLSAAGTTPSQAVARGEARTALEQAILLLPEVYRQVVRMYDLEDRAGGGSGAGVESESRCHLHGPGPGAPPAARVDGTRFEVLQYGLIALQACPVAVLRGRGTPAAA